MINFRFHLVSLIAVFLALGLGILVGSTVIDQGIVNRLDTEINSVRKADKASRASSKQLAQQNSQLQQFIDDAEPFVGDARLDGYSIAVVAERGVDGGVVKQTAQALQAAGADVPAVLRLDDSWKLDTPSQLQSLQSALGLQGSVSTTRDAALALLAQRLAKAPPSTSTSSSTTTTAPKSKTKTSTTAGATSTTPRPTTTTAPPPRVDALTPLEQSGFLDVTNGNASAFDAFPEHTVEVLVITGDDSDFAGTDLTAGFVRALVQVKVPTVVAAVYDDGSDPALAPKRGAVLASVLDDRVLSRATSTVDDLELVQGRVATVLALEIVGPPSSSTGHYGYGTGASAPLPPHRS